LVSDTALVSCVANWNVPFFFFLPSELSVMYLKDWGVCFHSVTCYTHETFWRITKSSQVVCTCTVTLFYLTTIFCHFLPLVHFACVWLVVLTEVFFFFPPSVSPDKCQHSTST
jgi:hypothetical protein